MMNRPGERVPEITVEALRARLSDASDGGDGGQGQGGARLADDRAQGRRASQAVDDHSHGRERRGPQVVDVREDWEWARGHIAGAAHIPLGQLPARLGELDPSRDLYFICHLGGRSEMATRFARERGLARAANVQGGMDAWESRGYPVVT